MHRKIKERLIGIESDGDVIFRRILLDMFKSHRNKNLLIGTIDVIVNIIKNKDDEISKALLLNKYNRLIEEYYNIDLFWKKYFNNK